MKNNRRKLNLILGVGIAGAVSIAAAKPAPALPGSYGDIRQPERFELPSRTKKVVHVTPIVSKKLTKRSMRFRKMDANGDGAISKREAEQAKSRRLLKHFTKFDLNSNGSVTLAELTSAKRELRAVKKNKTLKRNKKFKKGKALTKKVKLDRRGKEKRDRNVMYRRGHRG